MAIIIKEPKADVIKRTRIETTYEYVPILDKIIGFWRKEDEMKAGDDLVLNLTVPLTEFDRLFINGKEIKI